MTGLWQVSGKNRTTFEEMIRLDIHYAHHKSAWMDAKILALTPSALVQQVADSRARRAMMASTQPATETAG
jgi:lipopolysaccharide/colanic/teichoic acid biosynthesis glycosyltransferase